MKLPKQYAYLRPEIEAIEPILEDIDFSPEVILPAVSAVMRLAQSYSPELERVLSLEAGFVLLEDVFFPTLMRLEDAGRIDEALTILGALAANDLPENRHVHEGDRALMLAKAGRSEEAREQVDNLRKNYANEPMAQVSIGKVLVELGDYAAAEAAFRDVLTEGLPRSQFPMVYKDYAESLERQGLPEVKVRSALRAVLVATVFPDSWKEGFHWLADRSPFVVNEELALLDPFREEIAPALLEILADARKRPKKCNDTNAHLWAMATLADWGNTDAFPVVLDLLRLPTAELDIVFGDAVNELVHFHLARMVGQDVKKGASLLANFAAEPKIDEFASAAALEAIGLLVIEERLPKAEAMKHFASVYEEAKIGRFTRIDAAMGMLRLGAGEDSVSQIRSELEAGKYDAFAMEWVEFQEILDSDLESRMNEWRQQQYWLAESCRDAFAHWLIKIGDFEFDDEDDDDWLPGSEDELFERLVGSDGEAMDDWVAPAPFLAPPKVGRNDLCTCGSGKKYKKCCAT